MPAKKADTRPPLMTIPQAATEIGLSRWAVYDAINAGRLKAVKVDGVLRIRPADLDAYVEAKQAVVPFVPGTVA